MLKASSLCGSFPAVRDIFSIIVIHEFEAFQVARKCYFSVN